MRLFQAPRVSNLWPLKPGGCMLLLGLIYGCFSQTAMAGPFEEGMKSMQVGDFAEAFCLWRPLAEEGDARAAYHLGWLYSNGNGLKVNEEKAVYWWTRAAEAGHVDAMFALGTAYTTNEGLTRDPSKALHWYLAAADAGQEDARDIIRAKLKSGDPELDGRSQELLSRSWLGKPVTVQVDKANLRSSPNPGARLVATVLKDARLIAIGQRKGWYQVINPQDAKFVWIAGWLVDPPLQRKQGD